MIGIKYGDYHTWSDFGLIRGKKAITAPEVQTNFVEVPGRDGSIDYADAFGEPHYRDVTLAVEYTCKKTVQEQMTLSQTIKNALHGKRMKITLDDDTTHYYMGRVSVSEWSCDHSNHKVLTLTITAVCDPWRCKNAVTTVTRDDLTANYKTLTLTNERRSVVPTITVTEETTLLWGTATYTIAAGTYKLPDIVLVQGSNTLKAKLTTAASGSITVEYQEASL